MIVLDTHVWIWWVADPDQISKRARKDIDLAMEREEICISSISSWEVALLVRKGRLELTMPVDDWIARSEALPFIRFFPLDNRIALRCNQLPGEIHEDPADRIIIATAMTLGAPLVSKDTNIRSYPHVEAIW